jgi:hypothetical protein
MTFMNISVSREMKMAITKASHAYRYSLAYIVREAIETILHEKSYREIIALTRKNEHDGVYCDSIALSLPINTKKDVIKISELADVSISEVVRTAVNALLDRDDVKKAVND